VFIREALLACCKVSQCFGVVHIRVYFVWCVGHMQITGHCILCTEYVRDTFVSGYIQFVPHTKTGMKTMTGFRYHCFHDLFSFGELLV
jgi:hypothetical protein